MSGDVTGRGDGLAEVADLLRDTCYKAKDQDGWHEWAQAILESDWLRDHDARVKREATVGALREASKDVQVECSSSSDPCFCGSAGWLLNRADQTEEARDADHA